MAKKKLSPSEAKKKGRRLKKSKPKVRTVGSRTVVKTKTKRGSGSRKKVTKNKSVFKNGKLKKTTQVKKSKRNLSPKEEARNMKRGAAIGSVVGGVAAGIAGKKMKKASAKQNYSIPMYVEKNVYKPTTREERQRMTSLPKPIGTTKVPSYYAGKTISGKGNKNPDGSKKGRPMASSTGLGTFAGGVLGTALGSLKSKKRVRTKTVNGVNKTAQRQKVKSTRKKMRAKKRNIRRR